MVGIAKKVKQLLNLVRKYSPFLNTVIPGFSSVASIAADVGDKIVDGVSNVYDDYQENKKKGVKKYGIGDGIKSFFRPTGAVNTLTEDYGKINPRLGLSST
jgi:hypothetical protein